jgi:type IV secretory pathway TrbL component
MLGSIVGIGLWIWSLFLAQDYTVAVGTLGVILILGGFILRQFFKEPSQK